MPGSIQTRSRSPGARPRPDFLHELPLPDFHLLICGCNGLAYVPLQAKPGKEKEVADFLRAAAFGEASLGETLKFEHRDDKGDRRKLLPRVGAEKGSGSMV